MMDHMETKFREPNIANVRVLYKENKVQYKHSYIMEYGIFWIA